MCVVDLETLTADYRLLAPIVASPVSVQNVIRETPVSHH